MRELHSLRAPGVKGPLSVGLVQPHENTGWLEREQSLGFSLPPLNPKLIWSAEEGVEGKGREGERAGPLGAGASSKRRKRLRCLDARTVAKAHPDQSFGKDGDKAIS